MNWHIWGYLYSWSDHKENQRNACLTVIDPIRYLIYSSVLAFIGITFLSFSSSAFYLKLPNFLGLKGANLLSDFSLARSKMPEKANEI